MSDAAGMGDFTFTARLVRQLDEAEAKRRNALSKTQPGYSLRTGEVGNVLETFGQGEAFLVEFGPKAGSCDWLGVLYRSELELHEAAAAQRVA